MAAARALRAGSLCRRCFLSSFPARGGSAAGRGERQESAVNPGGGSGERQLLRPGAGLARGSPGVSA